MQALLVLAIVGSLVACKLTNSFWPLAFGGVILAIALLTKLRPSLPSLAFLKSGWFWSALGVVVITGVAFWWWNQPSSTTQTATRLAQWHLRWDKPSGYKGDTPQRSAEFIVDVVKNEKSLNIILNFQKGGKQQQAIFQGWKNGQGFRGTWNQPGDSGEWFLEFQTPNYAVGWLTDKKHGQQQPFMLLRK